MYSVCGFHDDLAFGNRAPDLQSGTDLHCAELVLSRRDELSSGIGTLHRTWLLDCLALSLGHLHLRWIGDSVDLSHPSSFEDSHWPDAVAPESLGNFAMGLLWLGPGLLLQQFGGHFLPFNL